MTGAPGEGSVAVRAEWALWGKERTDPEYRLLASSPPTSPASITADQFTWMIRRYLPGTLEADSLPQVTISWLRRKDTHYLAIGIHDRVADGGAGPGGRAVASPIDAAGRVTITTRYFCLPFGQLAAGAVSYPVLYERFGAFRLPPEVEGLIPAELPAGRRTYTPDQFAMASWAAAALLSSSPVCVQGGRGWNATARLWFLDAVAALLPYGMRSELSAATWVSARYKEHRFRLYFASAARDSGHRKLDLDHPVIHTTGSQAGDEYLHWLRSGDPAQRVAQLAMLKKELKFKPESARAVLTWAAKQPGRTRAPSAPLAADNRDDATRPAGRPQPGLVHESGSPNASVLQLLRLCAGGVEDPDLGSTLAALERHLWEGNAAAGHPGYRDVVRDGRLLCPNPALDLAVLDRLYGLVVEVAFGKALSYDDFLEIETCACVPAGRVMPAPLINVVVRCSVGSEGTWTLARLFQLEASNDPTLGSGHPGAPLAPGRLVGLIAGASPDLRPHHRYLAWDIVSRRLQHLDRSSVRAILRERRFFAGDLADKGREPEERVSTLSHLLRLAYTSPLSPEDTREVLSHSDDPAPEELAAAIRLNGKYPQVNRKQATSLLTTRRLRGQESGGRLMPRWPWHWRWRSQDGASPVQDPRAGGAAPDQQAVTPRASPPVSLGVDRGAWKIVGIVVVCMIIGVVVAALVFLVGKG